MTSETIPPMSQQTAGAPVAPSGFGSLARRHWPIVVGLIAFAFWLIGLSPVHPIEMDGYGLIKRLSLLTLISYPMMIVAAVAELRRPDRRNWVLAVATMALIVMVYGISPAVEGGARLPVAWLHAGFTDYIAQTGTVLGNYDTRFEWPGFFAAAAFIARAAGLSNPEPLLSWAPVVFAGLAVLAVRSLSVSVLGNRRTAWIATWIYLLANWTEQDYFSPQSTAIVLFLTALAVTVRFLVRPGIIEGGRVSLSARPVPETSPRNRIWAQLVVIGISVALAPTHQLTPYVLVGMLFVLLLFGRLRSGWLPFLAFVPVAAWFVLGAKSFWVSQLDRLTSAVGRVDSSVTKGIGDRFTGDFGHQLMVTGRVGLTITVAVLACLGFLVLRRRGVRTWTLPGLAASAFVLALLQPYGGEVFVRCYLFALPWFAIGGAIALGALLGTEAGEVKGALHRAPALVGRQLGPTAIIAAVLAVFALTTVTVRGGNDAYVAMTTADADAMNYVYDNAATGDVVVAPAWYSPLRLSRVGDLRQIAADQLGTVTNPCDQPELFVGCIAGAAPEFVVINPQQEQAGRILSGLPAGWMDDIVTELETAHGYRVVFDEDGSLVLASRSVP